jgi:hypothetical protein
MTKSNVTVTPVVEVSDGSRGIGYYCAGRHCAKREQCHRHTSSIVERNAQFDDYDKVMLTEGKCKFFIDIKEVTQLGLNTQQI